MKKVQRGERKLRGEEEGEGGMWRLLGVLIKELAKDKNKEKREQRLKKAKV